MSKSFSVPDEVVVSKIYLIRGHKVMLDDDLAELYHVETRRLNNRLNEMQIVSLKMNGKT